MSFLNLQKRFRGVVLVNWSPCWCIQHEYRDLVLEEIIAKVIIIDVQCARGRRWETTCDPGNLTPANIVRIVQSRSSVHIATVLIHAAGETLSLVLQCRVGQNDGTSPGSCICTCVGMPMTRRRPLFHHQKLANRTIWNILRPRSCLINPSEWGLKIERLDSAHTILSDASFLSNFEQTRQYLGTLMANWKQHYNSQSDRRGVVSASTGHKDIKVEDRWYPINEWKELSDE